MDDGRCSAAAANHPAKQPLKRWRGLQLFIPNVASVAGFPLTFQWAIFDPLAADGIAHSAAITTTPP